LAAMEPSVNYREQPRGEGGVSAAEPGSPLPPTLLYRHCDPAELPFQSVGELTDPLGPIGQDRAVEAVEFAVAMRRKGYNIYALGAIGTGKHTVIQNLLQRHAESAPTPIGVTSTTSPIRRNLDDCNCRPGAATGCARE